MAEFAPQEITNSAWSMSALLVADEPLLNSLAAEAIKKCGLCIHQDLSNPAWAFAKLSVRNDPFLDAISSEAIKTISEYIHQDLSNTAWAFATLLVGDVPLLAAISAEARPKMSELGPQDLANTPWAFATLVLQDEPLLEAISASAISKIAQFDAQHLSNPAWACAAIGFADETLLDAISASSISLISDFDLQNISNTSWAFAPFAMGARPLITSLSASALRRIADFMPQELSNTAWALSRRGVVDEPLMASISEAAIAKIGELSVQDLTNIPWSFANLIVQDAPLMEAISAKALANISAFASALSAPMLLWTVWKAGLTDVVSRLFDEWSASDVFTEAEPFGLFQLDNDWWKDVGWELQILDHMHRLLPVRSVQVSMVRFGVAPQISLRTVHYGLQKIAQLVDFVESKVEPGHPASILRECEVFARCKGQWLKVAGLEKAEILETGLGARPPRDDEFILEFGVFVGYTVVRLSREAGRRRPGVGVASLEVNPVHVCVARHMLDLGELAGAGEVKAGQAKDAVPRMAEELGAGSVGYSFMDHRGTIFHQDFSLLERHGLFGARARFVTDNTLNPGAPVFLWERLPTHGQGRRTGTVCWALTEFLSDHEDWTAVTDLAP